MLSSLPPQKIADQVIGFANRYNLALGELTVVGHANTTLLRIVPAHSGRIVLMARSSIIDSIDLDEADNYPTIVLRRAPAPDSPDLIRPMWFNTVEHNGVTLNITGPLQHMQWLAQETSANYLAVSYIQSVLKLLPSSVDGSFLAEAQWEWMQSLYKYILAERYGGATNKRESREVSPQRMVYRLRSTARQLPYMVDVFNHAVELGHITSLKITDH